MRVLLTGASSLLGAHVVRLLHARGDEVRVLQRRPSAVAGHLGITEILADLVDTEAVTDAVAGVDCVVHLAARVGVVGTAQQFYETNVAGTAVLLEAAQAAGVGRFVFVSSPSVAHSGSALAGSGTDPADPIHAKGRYSRTKAIAELRVLAADEPGFATIAVRPHLVWGPGDTQLIGRIISRARSGRLALVAEGRPLIDTTFIDNAAEAVVAAVDRAPAGHGQAFVVSNAQPRTVAEIVERVCSAAGVAPPTRSIPTRVAWAAGAVFESVWSLTERCDDPPMTRFLAVQLGTAHWFDVRRTEEVLGWAPRITLDEGFERLRESFADGSREGRETWFRPGQEQSE